jgi:aspartokinase-like uncharacterized kinase
METTQLKTMETSIDKPNAERILITKIVIASGGNFENVEDEIAKLVKDEAHAIVLDAMEEYAKEYANVKTSELRNILFNCRTQIEFMNDAYCDGDCTSAKSAISSIDKILNH